MINDKVVKTRVLHKCSTVQNEIVDQIDGTMTWLVINIDMFWYTLYNVSNPISQPV